MWNKTWTGSQRKRGKFKKPCAQDRVESGHKRDKLLCWQNWSRLRVLYYFASHSLIIKAERAVQWTPVEPLNVSSKDKVQEKPSFFCLRGSVETFCGINTKANPVLLVNPDFLHYTRQNKCVNQHWLVKRYKLSLRTFWGWAGEMRGRLAAGEELPNTLEQYFCNHRIAGQTV